MQLRHNDATREFRMSEKPARRVDTRDGSATELSITTKFFFTKWERCARRSLQALRSRSPEGADTHSRATLNRRGRSPWPDEGRRREIQVSVGFQAERSHSRFARNNQQLGARVLPWDARIARARQRHPYVGSTLTPDWTGSQPFACIAYVR